MSESNENTSLSEKFIDDINYVADFVESIQESCSRLLTDTDNGLTIGQIVIEVSGEIMYVIQDLIKKPGYHKVICDYLETDNELRQMNGDELQKIEKYVSERIRLIIVHLLDFKEDEKKLTAVFEKGTEKSKLANLLIHCSEVMYIYDLLGLITRDKVDYYFGNDLDDFMGKYWDIFLCELETNQSTGNVNSSQEEIKKAEEEITKAKRLVGIFYDRVSGKYDFNESLTNIGARKIFREFLEYFIVQNKIVEFPSSGN